MCIERGRCRVSVEQHACGIIQVYLRWLYIEDGTSTDSFLFLFVFFSFFCFPELLGLLYWNLPHPSNSNTALLILLALHDAMRPPHSWLALPLIDIALLDIHHPILESPHFEARIEKIPATPPVFLVKNGKVLYFFIYHENSVIITILDVTKFW